MFYSSLLLYVLLTLLCVTVVYSRQAIGRGGSRHRKSGKSTPTYSCMVDEEKHTTNSIMKSAKTRLDTLISIEKYYDCLKSETKPGDVYFCHKKVSGEMYGLKKFEFPSKIDGEAGDDYVCRAKEEFNRWAENNYYKIPVSYIEEKVKEDQKEYDKIRSEYLAAIAAIRLKFIKEYIVLICFIGVIVLYYLIVKFRFKNMICGFNGCKNPTTEEFVNCGKPVCTVHMKDEYLYCNDCKKYKSGFPIRQKYNYKGLVWSLLILYASGFTYIYDDGNFLLCLILPAIIIYFL